MTWSPVPWFVGGGAEHPAEVARLLSYAAMGGNEGVIGPGDCKVTATGTPSNKVSVAAGPVSVISGSRREAYLGLNVGADLVTIAPTTASGPRTDLLVARVEDPNVPGASWQAPSDVRVGPYIYSRVIPNVPAGTTRFSQLGLDYDALALARITVPASTATITNAMITDLRQLARPRRERLLVTHTPSGPDQVLDANGPPGFERWPSFIAPFTVPTWCTHMIVVITGYGVSKVLGGSVIGDLYCEFPDFGNNTPVTFGKTLYEDDWGTGANKRLTVGVAGELAIGPEHRGQVRGVALVGGRNGNLSSPDGFLRANDGSKFTYDVEFQERVA